MLAPVNVYSLTQGLATQLSSRSQLRLKSQNEKAADQGEASKSDATPVE
jgi:hypothetical protein